MNKNISIKDIAKKSNCSISTVSRYLNNHYVSSETKEIIKQVIEDLNYVPNANAQLMRKNDNVIFVISPSVTKPKSQLIIEGLTNLFKGEVFIFSAQGNYDPNHFKNTIINAMSRNPKYVVIFLPYEDRELINFINSINNIKLIILTSLSNISDKHTIIEIDDYSSFKELTEILIKQEKFDNIAFVNRSPNQYNVHMDLYNKRSKGFFDVIKKHPNIRAEIEFIEENTISCATSVIDKLYEKGFRNFICATHTIFRSCINNEKLVGCTFTDYGGINLSDSSNKYKYKIFVDKDRITNTIFNQMLLDQKPKKIKIIPSIIINKNNNGCF